MPGAKGYSHIGDIIKAHRRLMNLTQEQVSEMLDISQQQYQKYEYWTSLPSIDMLIKISEVLQFPIEKLFQAQAKKDDFVEDVEKRLIKYSTFVNMMDDDKQFREFVKYYNNNRDKFQNTKLVKILIKLAKIPAPKRKKALNTINSILDTLI